MMISISNKVMRPSGLYLDDGTALERIRLDHALRLVTPPEENRYNQLIELDGLHPVWVLPLTTQPRNLDTLGSL